MSFRVLKGERVVIVDKVDKDCRHISGREFTAEEFKKFGGSTTKKTTTKKTTEKKVSTKTK